MKLAVVVPYRDREEHLNAWLPAVRGTLDDQGLHAARLMVVEQDGDKPFNRGKLLNVGAHFAHEYSHLCFHDVDMLPEQADYSGTDAVAHLAGRCSQFGYALPYPEYFGGVTLFSLAAFRKANGFNNEFWGWGCEDDDLHDRCLHHGIPIERRDGRFTSLPHPPGDLVVAGGETYRANYQRLMENRTKTNEYAINGLNTLKFQTVFKRTRLPGLRTPEGEMFYYMHVKVRI